MDDKQKRILKILFIAIFLVGIIAYLDIQGNLMWTNSGMITSEQYTNGQFPHSFTPFFFSIVLALITLASLTYFILYKDKSEAVALGISSYVIWLTGTADVLYFWLQGKAIPLILPWLQNHKYIGFITHYAGVTNISLIVSALIGIGIAYLTTKFLVENL